MNTKPSYELAINFLREKFPNLMEAEFERIPENGKWSCVLTVNGVTQISVEDTASEAAQTAAILVAKRFGWIDPRSKKNLKRTNWTTEEVIRLLESQKIAKIDDSGDRDKDCENYNFIVDEMVSFFYDFLRPVEEMGAMAYCEETGEVYHVGEVYPE